MAQTSLRSPPVGKSLQTPLALICAIRACKDILQLLVSALEVSTGCSFVALIVWYAIVTPF